MLFLITDQSSIKEFQVRNGDAGAWSDVTDSVSCSSANENKGKERGDNGSV